MQVARTIRLTTVAIALVCGTSLRARSQETKPTRVLLDRVVAVVNNRAILASDVERAMRLSIMEPRQNGEVPDPKSTLDRLISRSLIQQQMGREEEVADAPTDKDVQSRIAEIRKELPACVRANCATDEGWSAFLAANKLTIGEVESYLRLRLQFLSFIENRFRSGIHITPEEIQAYYTNTLVPQYANQKPPALESVSQRIEEILLQEQVNKLFSAWLDNLRKQGDVQILDPSLEMPASRASNGGDNE